ncbi:hypothetical protein [Streptomyces sp. NPDC005732]|uniref:hypothetical protein n=1 Tax=Streptomyces sp. NPDC005732 TaxID=3157057 RepID=UPI0033C6C805
MMMFNHPRLLAFRAAHGAPETWSPADFDAYLDLSEVSVAEAIEDTDRTASLLDSASAAFGLADDFGPPLLTDEEFGDLRELDIDFEAVVVSGLLAAEYVAYPPVGHGFPGRA